MVVHPTQTPDGSPVVAALERALQRVLGRSGGLVDEPGHLRSEALRADRRRAALRRLRARVLDLAHQPDEYVEIADLVNATKVIALAVLDLTGTA